MIMIDSCGTVHSPCTVINDEDPHFVTFVYRESHLQARMVEMQVQLPLHTGLAAM